MSNYRELTTGLSIDEECYVLFKVLEQDILPKSESSDLKRKLGLAEYIICSPFKDGVKRHDIHNTLDRIKSKVQQEFTPALEEGYMDAVTFGEAVVNDDNYKFCQKRLSQKGVFLRLMNDELRRYRDVVDIHECIKKRKKVFIHA